MREVRFTFDWYDDMLATLHGRDYAFTEFDATIESRSVLLRHDVDWSPRKAVRLAEIEADHNITATYFFLVTSPFYNVLEGRVRERIERIADLGHRIGLHFSTHQYFERYAETETSDPPADDALVAATDNERGVLSRVAGEPIDVVSFHNPPEWVFRRTFEAFVSTYEARFFDNIAYFADSNQRWRDESPFEAGIPSKVQILTHPVLWGERDAFATDRLREERDYLFRRIGDHLEATDRTWTGTFGLE